MRPREDSSNFNEIREVEVIDSHTEGEPTRVVIRGWPQPTGDTMTARRADMAERYDDLRRAIVTEPRGHDAIVGALLTPPVHSGSVAGVVFFNDVGYLGMCGHGLIGLVRTLESMGAWKTPTGRIDTPVGTVEATLNPDASVTFRNVPSFLYAQDAVVQVPKYGPVVGDVAYGGNWFFLTEVPEVILNLNNLDHLLSLTKAIRRALAEQGIYGTGGAPIDHVELFSPTTRPDADARNFVLCPGNAYDRSPCGTGTSAKLATLYERGQLAAGQAWRQESITGGMFVGSIQPEGEDLIPLIRGRAFVIAHSRLRLDPADPFRYGFPEYSGPYR